MRETLRLVVFFLGGAVALARAKGSTSVDAPYEGERSEFGALLSTISPELPTNSPELPDFSGMHKMNDFNPQKNGYTTRAKADGSTGKKHKMYVRPNVTDENSTKQPAKSKKKSKASTRTSKKDGKKLKKSSKKSSRNATLSPTLSPTSSIAPSSIHRPTGTPSDAPTMQPSTTKPSTSLTGTLAPVTLAPTFGTPIPTSAEPDSSPPDVTPVPSTLAPTERDQDCSALLDECCVDSDCGDSQICANRNCVQQGCPQFTLTWTGRAEHDLFVIVPSGVRISFMNRFDPDSGGAWEGDTLPDRQFGYYAENVYFSPNCTSPPGIYQYFLVSEVDDEDWTISVSKNGDIQSTVSGKGPSEIFEYVVHGADSVSPTSASASHVPSSTPSTLTTPITPFPSSVPTSNFESSAPSNDCQVPQYECCSDDECLVDGTTCANRNCVVQGTMRFTLTWFGLGTKIWIGRYSEYRLHCLHVLLPIFSTPTIVDDKNLQVQAPGGQPIDATNPVDPVSGGTLEENVIPTGLGYHAENIFFPTDRPIIPGDYQVLLIGNSDSEPWTITLTIDGVQISSLTGTDLSRSLVVAVSAPPSKCDPSVDECCMDDDCQDGFACAARNCVMVGYPRFTLSWLGSDDKDLIVTTPDGTDIFFANVFDPVSGGRLEGDVVPDEFDFYAENIYFPVDGSAPAGVYEYLVRGNGEEPWNVTVALNFTVVENVSGVGDQIFTYQFGEIAPTDAPVPTPAPVGFTLFPTGQCSSSEDQCCESEDCEEMSSCSNRNCVRNGNPRFTLTWVGEGKFCFHLRSAGR